MPNSMTGFGRAELRRRDVRVQCEVRSVNHRYLALKLRLPPVLMCHEAWIDARVRRRISRGTVELHVQHQATSMSAVSTLDEAVADRYLRTFRSYLARRKISANVSHDFLFQLPGVLVSKDASRVAQSARGALQKVVDQALDAMVAMRVREGARLEKVLRREMKVLRTCARRIQSQAPALVREHGRRMKQRVDALLADQAIELDPVTLAREMALVADRQDVTEELDRLESHLEEMDRRLGASGPVGRSLDFVVQEVSREIHTIGSKIQGPKPFAHVLRAKATVEKLREQVQNIE